MSNNVYYWDACIFISYYKGEEINENKTFQDGLINIVNEVSNNKASIITSSLIFSEVLRATFSSLDIYNRFSKLFSNPNYMTYDVDTAISKQAAKIREVYQNIKTPDAIHLATAIIHKVTEFHTFDGMGKNKGLLDYASNFKKDYNLVIKIPSVPVGSLL